jgi:hypothetical protein
MKRMTTAMLFLALTTCGPILHGTGPESNDTSSEHAPPLSWEAGIQFQFADSAWKGRPRMGDPRYGAEVRFHDGRTERVVTGGDLYNSPSGAILTPWYRIWLPADRREVEPSLRVTIGDRGGNRASAEYPVRIVRGDFYHVLFGVYTPQPVVEGGWVNPARPTIRAFDVPAGAKSAPSDSLRIGYYAIPRP